MMTNQPISAQSVATNDEKTIADWADAQAQFRQATKYWLATINPNGKPHVMPIVSVWEDDCVYFTSSPTAQKAKNIAQNPHCVITADDNTLDVIIEGDAHKVIDGDTLERVKTLYAAKYDWPISVEGTAYTAPYAAPSAGLPPYELYEIRLTKAYGFGTEETYGATRWQFS